MADHTLGRRLIEGHRKVKVFGLERDVWAEIHKINGLSAHADREDLLSFVEHTAARGHLEAVVLVHGEDRARAAMAESLKEMGIRRVVLAQRGERLELSTVAERRQR